MKCSLAITAFFTLFYSTAQPEVKQWETYEIDLASTISYSNPYTEIDVWAVFVNQENDSLIRPAFWDGDNSWKIRFAPTDTNTTWRWTSFCSDASNQGLNGQMGSLKSVRNDSKDALITNGLLRMSAGHRNIVQQSGKPFLIVADTPWALPFRATKEQAVSYADDRQKKGFNTALLMTVQPDTKAEGPNARNTDQGFARGFSDLSERHLNELQVDYFQYYDDLIQILLSRGIVPVHQPVFHGFGWKGKQALGVMVHSDEYVRFVKYLLGRYGSYPAIWLVSADHNGQAPGVKESGEMLEKWDCYQQPTGVHYNPCDDFLAEWAANADDSTCFHFNKTHQKAKWLDFQWAQTGHNGEHQYHKVSRMYANQPTKGAANGEPTYEGMGGGAQGLGWWQGEEAWMQLMHGGTMGVFYGAASLWQWKISADEKGWYKWTDQPLSWQDAMSLKGSTYVGLVGKILEDIDCTDIEKKWEIANGMPLLAKEGKTYISFLKEGGTIQIKNLPQTLRYRWVNPKTGEVADRGMTSKNIFIAPNRSPWILLVF